MVVDLFEEGAGTHVVADLGELDREGVCAVARLRQGGLGVLDGLREARRGRGEEKKKEKKKGPSALGESAQSIFPQTPSMRSESVYSHVRQLTAHLDDRVTRFSTRRTVGDGDDEQRLPKRVLGGQDLSQFGVIGPHNRVSV